MQRSERRDYYDPAQLLRRSWADDPDALAQEIYVAFTTGLRPSAAPARPGGTGLAAKHPGPPTPVPKRSAPVALASAPPIARPPAIAPPLAPSSIAPRQPDRPATPPPAPIPSRPQTDAEVRVGTPDSSASPPPAPSAPDPDAAVGPGAEVPRGLRSIPATDARPRLRASAPSITPEVDPIPPRPRPASGSGRGIYTRQANGTPSASAPPPPEPFETLVASTSRLDPNWFQNPTILRHQPRETPAARPMRSTQDIVDTVRTRAADAPRKPTLRDRTGVGRLGRNDLDFDDQDLVLVGSKGATGYVASSTGGIVGTPGQGDCYILQFDGSNLSMYSTDTMTIFNLSWLPFGAGTLVPIQRIGGYYFFANRPQLAHGIITVQIQPCGGTTPGTGKVQLYYMSGGTMKTCGSPVNVENWYSATGAVGKHCGIVEADGALSLEVLDC